MRLSFFVGLKNCAVLMRLRIFFITRSVLCVLSLSTSVSVSLREKKTVDFASNF